MENIDLGSFFATYGDVIELKLPSIETEVKNILPQYENYWKKYNPRKADNPRFGLSLTSLDGGMTGVPDLDSLREINKIHSTDYREKHFATFTELTKALPGLHKQLSSLNPVGRSHFIKLNKGGHFPPHRDGGILWPSVTLRLFCTIQNCDSNQFVWLQDGKQLFFKPATWYVINTSKAHSVFSFTNDCIFTVLNVPISHENLNVILNNLRVV